MLQYITDILHHVDVLNYIVYQPPTPEEMLQEDMDEVSQYRERILLTIFAFALGSIAGIRYCIRISMKKIRFDYSVPKDRILRVFTDGKSSRKWIVINPSTVSNYYDIILLATFDRGSNKIVEERSKRRVRRVRIIIQTILWMIAIYTFILIMSASHTIDLNPFGYFRWK